MSSNRNPFILKPASKEYIWGGSRLIDELSKDIDSPTVAETWECSTHPEGPSLVKSGFFKDMNLINVIKENPDFLGTNHLGRTDLPILVKFIDAKRDLSVQVHPDDEYAKINENGQLGKNEFWYVLGADPNAKINYGFRHDVNKQAVEKLLNTGEIEKYLRNIKVEKDDFFFVGAGTVHAIGAGCFICEIQQSSNLTYRLYDFNREDSNHKKRELHIDKALAVTNFKKTTAPKRAVRCLEFKKSFASLTINKNNYFVVSKLFINTETNSQLCEYQSTPNTFEVLMCIDGCGVIITSDEHLLVFKGDTIFIPASSNKFKFHGNFRFLKVNC